MVCATRKLHIRSAEQRSASLRGPEPRRPMVGATRRLHIRSAEQRSANARTHPRTKRKRFLMESASQHKRLRLPGYDYSTQGAYFVTICTKDRRRILSSISEDHLPFSIEPSLTEIGKCLDLSISSIPDHYPGVYVDQYVIMPNHVHILLRFETDARAKLGRIIQQLKGFVTKQCGKAIWQDKYYDHIIRDEGDYLTRYQYIVSNPGKWAEDEYY